MKLTDGLGADIAIDVAGPATLNQTLRAVRGGGRILLMGVLTGFDGSVDTSANLRKPITLQGIDVVPASTLKSLIATGIKPVIDRVFPFEKTEAAYSAIEGAGHVGKIVIKVAE